jgi:hypothetical protein
MKKIWKHLLICLFRGHDEGIAHCKRCGEVVGR